MDYRDSADLSGTRTRRAGRGGGRSGGGIGGGLGGGLGGGRGGRPMAVGGGIGGVLILLLALFLGPSLGLNVGDLMGGQGGGSNAQPGSYQTECSGQDAKKNRDCRWAYYETAVQKYWSGAIRDYKYADMQLYSGTVRTACGMGQTQMGPFYCPGDSTVYIDDSFVGTLLNQLGAAGGDAAELYIVAHEYGHHIQNLDGTIRSIKRDSGDGSEQVRLELQADCYAGVFFHNTVKDPQSPIAAVSKDDLLRIADAAKSVGDDHIQRQQGGFVNPESWTHGSSEQRQRWVGIGFDTGNPRSCDTFSVSDADL